MFRFMCHMSRLETDLITGRLLLLQGVAVTDAWVQALQLAQILSDRCGVTSTHDCLHFNKWNWFHWRLLAMKRLSVHKHCTHQLL